MKTRVNLTIEHDLLKSAKAYAENHNMSLSKLVEDYLKVITKPVKRPTIFEIVESLGPANISPDVDLVEQYYIDKAKKYGF